MGKYRSSSMVGIGLKMYIFIPYVVLRGVG